VKHQYSIRSGALDGYEARVTALGGHAEKLLSACGLCLQDLEHPDTLIPFTSMVSLLELTAERLECPDFGLQLGFNQNVNALGNLGLLMLNCQTAREALIIAQRYIAVHSQAEYWRLHEAGNLAFVERFAVSIDVSHARQFKELSFAVCLKLIKTIIKGAVKIERLELAHAPISAKHVYKKMFECDVIFNQEHDRLVVNREYLDYSLSAPSSTAKQALESQLSQLAIQHHDLERQVTTIILQTLGFQAVSIDTVASIMNIHKRTLQRMLKVQGLSFKTLLKNIRIKTACWHLEASKIDLTLLSELLGYSDVSAFSKAFKQEKGISPLQWRKSKRTDLG